MVRVEYEIGCSKFSFTAIDMFEAVRAMVPNQHTHKYYDIRNASKITIIDETKEHENITQSNN